MYRVLEAEMVLKGKSREDLARAIDRTIGTLGQKLNKKNEITLTEAKTIKAELQTDKTIEELFEWSDE